MTERIVIFYINCCCKRIYGRFVPLVNVFVIFYILDEIFTQYGIENLNSIFTRTFHMIDRHISVFQQFLHALRRVRRSADSRADRQNFELIVHCLICHLKDLFLNGSDQILRGKYVIFRKKNRKFLSAVTRRITAFSNTAFDNLRDSAKRIISRLCSVQLIIQFKIIDINDRQRQRSVLILLKFFPKNLKEVFPVQKLRQLICARLIISRFIKMCILNGNGSAGSYHQNHIEIRPADPVIARRIGQQKDSHDILFISEADACFNPQILKISLFLFPHCLVFDHRTEFSHQKTVVSFHNFYQRIILANRK